MYSHFKADIASSGVSIRFNAGKPSDAIRSMLKGNGFRWSPGGGCWLARRVVGAADFLSALDRAMDEEAGIPQKPDAACWVCSSPDGFFRACGPATPVWCDKCAAERGNAPRYRN